MFVVVPDSLSNAIYEKIDAQIALCPNAAPDREVFYEHLIGYFHEHGVVPDFSLVKNTPKTEVSRASGFQGQE